MLAKFPTSEPSWNSVETILDAADTSVRATILQNYWATPGDALEAGESSGDAARCELLDETGILRDAVGRHPAELQRLAEVQVVLDAAEPGVEFGKLAG